MKSRRAEPRIVNVETHQRSSVCLAVAADFLGIDVRTVRARIDSGQLEAVRDGKVYRIELSELTRYERQRGVSRTTAKSTKSTFVAEHKV